MTVVFDQIRNIVFVNIYNFGEDQITVQDQFTQKTSELQTVPLLFFLLLYKV